MNKFARVQVCRASVRHWLELMNEMRGKQNSIGILLVGIGVFLLGIAALAYVLRHPSEKLLTPAEVHDIVESLTNKEQLEKQLNYITIVSEDKEVIQ